jgi:hypothetical protein
MKYIPPKFEKLKDMAAIDVGRLTEDEARTILEGICWPKALLALIAASGNNSNQANAKISSELLTFQLWF